MCIAIQNHVALVLLSSMIHLHDPSQRHKEEIENPNYLELKVKAQTGQMGLWIKALAAKSDAPSSIPGSHMVEGEN